MLRRRWVVAEMNNAYLRLDDTAILAQMEMRGVKPKRKAGLLDALMIMEDAALEKLNG